MSSQPAAKIIDRIRDIPIYRKSIELNFFPILEKPDIAHNFPDQWMTPKLATALKTGEAEFVLSTGTNHPRMQIIRPPYFLLNSYYQLWSQHPDIAFTWEQNCPRISLTTFRATEHVARVNASKLGVQAGSSPSLGERRLDTRTLYVNLTSDPALWTRKDVERMLDEIAATRQSHPSGWYHLDCSSYHLAHLVRKVDEWNLWKRFAQPASIVHAYEYTPVNVRRLLTRHFACPIIDLFGSTELGYLYYGDKHGRYRPYLDQMSLELIPVAAGGDIYSLIVSSMRNPYMPLIRYRSGDCVQTLDGSPDPSKIRRFCGREKELLRGPHGLVSQADFDDWVSAAAPTVFVYQLRHTDSQRARLHYTTFDDAPLGHDAAGQLRNEIRKGTGLDCSLAHLPHIAIGESGKYAWLVRDDQSTVKAGGGHD